ncbi:MAG: hypothetical protein K9M54_00860, partial [Kiritimatiellales bacterium]|nr:hypothetical protein [Kiritimatiellales bacterium]
MKKIMIIASMLLVSVTAGWAVNFFLPASGDWNVNTNWNDGHVPVITDVAQVNQGKTCTIQSGTYGVVSKQFIGADSDGTINVYGEFYFNATFEGLVFGLYNNGVGHGMLNVYDGGVVGTNTTVATDRRNAFVGYTSTSTVNNNRGTVNVYSNGAVYLKEVFVNYDTDNTGVSSINIHDGGLLDVSYNLWLGYNSGAASNAQVTVSGAGHLKVGNLNLGRYNASPLVNTFGTMTVNGSQVNVEISGNLSARSQSIMNFNFDDNGIAAVSALNFFHEGFTMNIVGTENVPRGEFWVVQGTPGGPQDQSPTFNISGFNPGSSNEVVKVVDS